MLYSFKNQTGTVSAFYGVINNRQDVQSSFARVFVCKKKTIDFKETISDGPQYFETNYELHLLD